MTPADLNVFIAAFGWRCVLESFRGDCLVLLIAGLVGGVVFGAAILRFANTPELPGVAFDFFVAALVLTETVMLLGLVTVFVVLLLVPTEFLRGSAAILEEAAPVRVGTTVVVVAVAVRSARCLETDVRFAVTNDALLTSFCVFSTAGFFTERIVLLCF